MRTKKHPVEKRIAPVQFFRKAALCKALTRNREKFLQLFAGVFLLNISGDERLFLTNRRPRQRARRRRFAGLPGTSQANEKTNCPFFRSSAHPLTSLPAPARFLQSIRHFQGKPQLELSWHRRVSFDARGRKVRRLWLRFPQHH